MSKTIQGVPDSISRADYTAMFEQYGFTPQDVASLSFEPDGIRAVVFDRHPESGGRYLANRATAEGGYAKHDVFIPVYDEEPTND